MDALNFNTCIGGNQKHRDHSGWQGGRGKSLKSYLKYWVSVKFLIKLIIFSDDPKLKLLAFSSAPLQCKGSQSNVPKIC